MADDRPEFPADPALKVVEAPTSDLAALYESDILAWSEQQAATLRARLCAPGRLDWDNLAEEIEDVGKSQYQSCDSQVENIVEHLLKVEWIGTPDDLRGWRKEIRAFRRTLNKRLTPTIAKRLQEALPDPFDYARKLVAEEYGAERVADARPYTWAEIVDEDWLPAPPPPRR